MRTGPHMFFLTTTLLFVFVCFCGIEKANAAPNANRSMVVLEYRSGSVALEHVEEKIAAILRAKTSLNIFDLKDAREIYGNNLDRRVVSCSGSVRCLARIGRKIAVDEILLVGVSEFGDVIITMQRINVAEATVVHRIAEAFASGTSPDKKIIEAYVRRLLPRSDFIRYGRIRIESNVKGAKVTVGEKNRGLTPIRSIRVLAPDTYDILLQKSGYTNFRASVVVPPDAEVKVVSNLIRITPRWYKSWWFWALSGTVVASTVTAAILYDDEVSAVPVTILPF